MLTITTNKGNAFQALYAGIGYNNMLKAQLITRERLPAIAAALDGAGSIVCTDENGVKTYVGYSLLDRIQRVDETGVAVFLMKEETNETD